MEYPGAKFTKSYRKALLIVTVSLFFIISPILVLYAAGYRYDWHDGLLRETGSISIDVLPANATAYIDNIAIPDVMPMRLKSITSGTYRIKITAPGFFDWEKEISVYNKQTTYIKDVQMIKKSKPTLLSVGAARTIFLSPNNQFIIYTTLGANSQKVWLWNIKNANQTLLTTLSNTDEITTQWSLNSTYVLVQSKKYPLSTALVFTLATAAQTPFDLVNFIKNESIEKIQWNGSNDSGLYVSTSNTLYTVLLTTGQKTLITPLLFNDWYMSDGQLWTLSLDTTTNFTNITKDFLGFSQKFASVPPDETTDSSTQNLWSLAQVNDDVVLLTANKPTMKLITQNEQFDVPAENFMVSPYNNWWIMWKPGELWTYAKGEKPYLLNRTGESLLGVTPLDSFNTLALAWTDRVTALFPYYLTYHNILDNSVNAMAADTKNRIVYFSGSVGKQEGLWSLPY